MWNMGADKVLPVSRADSDAELTVDELARETGTTVRNIRSLQTRGLLPPPAIRARTGYYGRGHAARVRMILAMQAEGFQLKAIERLLDRPEAAAEQIFNFGRTLLESFGGAAPEFATSDELAERFGDQFAPGLLRKAEKLGLIKGLGEERWEIRNPTLVSAGEQLVALGVPLSHALAVAEKIEQHTAAIAKAYVRLFQSDVLGGSNDVERTPAEWVRIQDSLGRLRPLAVEAIRASFEQAMSEQIEARLRKAIDA
jgi:DNA-binding transcriptional MerR regulator